MALSKKVIDGALIPFEIIPPLKIQEQTKYQIEGPNAQRFGTTSFSTIMNEGRWNSLPADIQKIFLDNSGIDWHDQVGKVWDKSEASGIAVAIKAGNTHIQLTEEEWLAFETKMAPVAGRWIAEMKKKGIDGKTLYDEAKKLVSENMKSE